jgi:hypothetical protein
VYVGGVAEWPFSGIFAVNTVARAPMSSFTRDLPPLSESGITGFSVCANGSTLIVDHTKRYATGLYQVKKG